MRAMNEPIGDLSNRMRDVFRLVVETYLDRGQPVGSKALAANVSLSPASIRGVMQALEERAAIEAGLRDRPIEEALAAASATLSGLSACAGVVLAPKTELRFRQLSFVPLDKARALAVLVGVDGNVENRVVPLPPGTSALQLAEIGNYVTARLSGLTLGEAVARLRGEHAQLREAIDGAAAELVASGLAAWSEDLEQRPVLIVKGAAKLIDAAAAENLERVRQLLEELEDTTEIARLLEGASEGQGCRIFIGSENRMFALSGSSVIAAPYRGSEGQVIGVVGVIGPTRLNYARVVPMVDFTAQALTRRMQ